MVTLHGDLPARVFYRVTQLAIVPSPRIGNPSTITVSPFYRSSILQITNVLRVAVVAKHKFMNRHDIPP